MVRPVPPVILLSGGTGGAKLARGLQEVVGDKLVVIANTGDDVEVHGVHVSPDPDLVTYWLADMIDARGWGIEGDTWTEMERLEAAGDATRGPATPRTWFRLRGPGPEPCPPRSEPPPR